MFFENEKFWNVIEKYCIDIKVYILVVYDKKYIVLVLVLL